MPPALAPAAARPQAGPRHGGLAAALARATRLLGALVGPALADPVRRGVAGSALVALGALGVGIVPKPDPLAQLPLVGLLRGTVPGRGLATAAVIAGSALLLSAWLAIGRDLRAGRGPGRPSVPALRRTMLLWAAPLVLAPPLFSRDAYSYAAQGNLVRHGYDPYVVGPWLIPGPFADSVDPMWATAPAPYGPLFLSVAGGIARLGGDSVYFGVLGMRALALVGVALLLVYLPRLARRCGVDPAGALWLGLVNPLTVMHFVSGAHNDALMLGLVLAGLTLALEGNPALGAAVVALGAGVKAPAALALGFVGHVWARRLAAADSARGLRGSPLPGSPAGSTPGLLSRPLVLGFLLAGGTGLGVFAALTAVTGVGYGWVGALDTPGSVRTWLSPPTALGMLGGGVAHLLGHPDASWALVDQVRTVSGALAVGLVGWLLLRRTGVPVGSLVGSPAGSPRPVVRGAALALLAVVLLGPVVQPWYLMWALVPLAAAGVRAREARPVMWGILALVVVSQLSGGTMAGPFAVPGSLAAVGATALVAVRARRAERALVGPRHVFDLEAVRARPDGAAPPARSLVAPR